MKQDSVLRELPLNANSKFVSLWNFFDDLGGSIDYFDKITADCGTARLHNWLAVDTQIDSEKYLPRCILCGPG